MTKLKQPTENEWKRLYELAIKVNELGPWEWMYEDSIFGVQNPETEEIGFVSIMGEGGEHFAIGVYLGAEGLFGFHNLHEKAADDIFDFPEYVDGIENNKIDENNAYALFEIPQLQVSFENREHLEKEDHAVIKKLAFKFRGSNNYPLFRSIVPGFMPYFITSDDARFLSYVLEQLLDFAPRVIADESILEDTDVDENYESFLVRIPKRENGKIVWNEEHIVIQPPAEKEISVTIPQTIIDEIIEFPQNQELAIEVDLFYSSTPVAGKGKRPFIPKMLLFADRNSGAIVGVELLQPQPTEVDNMTQLVANVFELLRKLGNRPRRIFVSSDDLFGLFRSFTQQLNMVAQDVNFRTDFAFLHLYNFFVFPS
jgi:hypothetical protein